MAWGGLFRHVALGRGPGACWRRRCQMSDHCRCCAARAFAVLRLLSAAGANTWRRPARAPVPLVGGGATSLPGLGRPRQAHLVVQRLVEKRFADDLCGADAVERGPIGSTGDEQDRECRGASSGRVVSVRRRRRRRAGMRSTCDCARAARAQHRRCRPPARSSRAHAGWQRRACARLGCHRPGSDCRGPWGSHRHAARVARSWVTPEMSVPSLAGAAAAARFIRRALLLANGGPNPGHPPCRSDKCCVL